MRIALVYAKKEAAILHKSTDKNAENIKRLQKQIKSIMQFTQSVKIALLEPAFEI